jgi:hypothetical protein
MTAALDAPGSILGEHHGSHEIMSSGTAATSPPSSGVVSESRSKAGLLLVVVVFLFQLFIFLVLGIEFNQDLHDR